MLLEFHQRFGNILYKKNGDACLFEDTATFERLGRALLHHQENRSSGLHIVYAWNLT
jgi:hypothetical protein